MGHILLMKQTDPHFKIRLPPELKDKVAEAARATGRSMNAEIVDRLNQSFTKLSDAVRDNEASYVTLKALQEHLSKVEENLSMEIRKFTDAR